MSRSEELVQTVHCVPEVEVVPGKEAGGEVGLTDNGLYVSASEISCGEVCVGLLQECDR